MTEYRKPLTAALTNYNRQEVNLALEPYKEKNGLPNYGNLLSIYERLPGMMKRDYNGTLAMIVVALTKAFEAMNLSRPMNNDQIIELGETILESSNEDILALEDVVLFLQCLVRGKYGPLYESMDIPKFMDKFEIYRNERYQTLMRHRLDESDRMDALGDSNRFCWDNDFNKDVHRNALKDYLQKNYKAND